MSDEAASASPYEMTISLHVLEHLGIGLYSNVPAVLSEVVANSWDADANRVDVDVDTDEEVVIIQDDGVGMTEEDINRKYLRVGYRKREHEGNTTPSGRPIMGRKGIGKLSVFSIAGVVEVYSAKQGERNALRMEREEIKKRVEGEEGVAQTNGQEDTAKKTGTYNPDPISAEPIDFDQGTRIVLKDLDRRLNTTSKWLRQRLARRFSLIGQEEDFNVFVNGKRVTAKDRGYYHKLEFVWYFGEESSDVVDECDNLRNSECVDPHVTTEIVDGEKREYEVRGWIGTVEKPSELEDIDNSVVVFTRGKLAHEDILQHYNEARIFSKYVIGEIDANFLDQEDREDIITSNRQSLKEDDNRFIQLKEHVRETLDQIRGEWDDLRRERSKERALENPILEEWYEGLQGDNRKHAEKLFKRIETLKNDDEESKAELYRASILAFEKLALRDKLSSLEKVRSEKDFDLIRDLFSGIDELEASHYYEIAKGRLEVLERFIDIAPEAKEQVIQEHLFDHLWLLDPSWERATGTSRKEERVTTAFEEVNANLTDYERKGRYDIKYKSLAGKHVIVELKKYDRRVTAYELAEQVGKYRSALEKVLREQFQIENPDIECICVIGKEPTKPENPKRARDILEAEDARFVTYEQLIEQAKESYSDYLEAKQEISETLQLVDELVEHERNKGENETEI